MKAFFFVIPGAPYIWSGSAIHKTQLLFYLILPV